MWGETAHVRGAVSEPLKTFRDEDDKGEKGQKTVK